MDKEDKRIKFNKENSLKAVERKLYDPARKSEQRPRRKIHGPSIDIKQDFDDSEYEHLLNSREKYKLPTSLFKKIFIAVLIFFGITLSIAAIILYDGKKSVSEELIAMEILGQPFVDGGETFELTVRIQNFNEQNLQLPDLILSYPKDSSVDAERVFLRRSLQDIANKQQVNETFTIALFGQEGDVRNIDATLEYRIEGSSAIFVKEISHEILIRSAPTHITVNAPDTVVRNQELVLSVDVSSNSNIPVNNTILKINYPRGFELLGSSRPADFNNNTWYFENIGNEAKRIEITGRLAGLEGQGQSFDVEFGQQDQLNKNKIVTVLNSVTQTVNIKQSFIDVQLRVNNSDNAESSVRGGSDINVVVDYENTLDTNLENIQIKVNLAGNLYDPKQLNLQDGFYNSSIAAVIFDQTTSERLRLLEPGETGEFRFTVYTKELVSAAGVLTNPFVEFSVDVMGTSQNGKVEQASSITQHRVLANSDITVIPRVQYYEGAFKNNGPMPPRVNIPTTYTLVFQVTNSSNEVAGGELSTTFPPYVNWLNAISPSVERANVTFDNTTRKLTWKLGTIRAGVGVGSNPPRQLSVQVQIIPSTVQVGEAIDLTNDIVLTGTDTFTDTTLNYKKTPVANRLSDRTKVGADGRIIQ